MPMWSENRSANEGLGLGYIENTIATRCMAPCPMLEAVVVAHSSRWTTALHDNLFCSVLTMEDSWLRTTNAINWCGWIWRCMLKQAVVMITLYICRYTRAR